MIDNSAEVIARLSARLEALEQRVLQLEQPSAAKAAAPLANAALDDALGNGTPGESRTLPPVVTPSVATAGGAFPVLGKALLGMAGAYLLRALVEAGTLPKLVVVVALLYAGAWLVGAARVRGSHMFAGLAYGLTSAFILAPMLSEMTLRFHVLSPTVSAAVLVAFAIGALALTWKNNFAAVFWVGFATSLLMALVLMIATQDLVPFLSAILVIAFASEAAACVGHALNGRVLAAVATDLGIIALLYIYSLPEGARAGYGSVGVGTVVVMASVPFLLAFTSVTLRSAWRRRRIAIADMIQTVVAFGLAAFAAMTFGEGEYRVAFGIFCVGIAAVGYAIAFGRFRGEGLARNFRAYSTWSAVLLLLGSYISLPQLDFAITLGIAAVLATAVGARLLQPALEFEGAAFLLAAAAVSGLFAFDGGALIGSQRVDTAWIFALVLACALGCYALAGRLRGPGWEAWIPNLLSAAIAAGTAAAFVSLLLARISGRTLSGSPGVGLLEFLHTFTLCAVALALAFGGSRARRQELVWLAYAALVVTAAKILLEDVRHGHLIVIAASFFLYAATLILLPRLAGHGHREPVGTDI